MREIKFRGQRTDNKEWVYGNLINWNKKLQPRIIWFKIEGESLLDSEQIETNFEVLKETIGQFTGLKDFKDVEIWEGDIVKTHEDWDIYGHQAGEINEVIFSYGGFRLKAKNPKAKGYWLEDGADVIVIGNIHENPEILKP